MIRHWSGSGSGMILRGDEFLDRHGRGPNIAHQRVGCAVVGCQDIEYPTNQFATAANVINGDRHIRKQRSPQLTGDHTHLDLNPVCLALGFREHVLGRDPRFELKCQFLDKTVSADPPGVRGPGKDIVTEKRDVIFQRCHDSPGLRVQLALAGLQPAELEQFTGIKADGSLGLPDGRLGFDTGRTGQRLLGYRDHLRDLLHPRQGIFQVDRPWQRGLGQQQIDALRDVVSIDARVVLERMEVLRKPDLPRQIVTENVMINLAVRRKPVRGDLLCQLLENLAFEVERGLPSRPREIVKLIVERVLAKSGGRQRLTPEKSFEIVMEDGIQPGILIVRTDFFHALNGKTRHEQHCQHHADA